MAYSGRRNVEFAPQNSVDGHCPVEIIQLDVAGAPMAELRGGNAFALAKLTGN
jgi:hypothetical protein